MRTIALPLAILALLLVACGRSSEAPAATVDLAPTPAVPAPFVIELGPGDGLLTATVRTYRIAWGDRVHVIDLASDEAVAPVYAALEQDLARAWEAGPKEPIPGLAGRRWSTRPIHLAVEGRVDCGLVMEMLQLTASGHNPAAPYREREEPPCFGTITIIDEDGPFVFEVPVGAPVDEKEKVVMQLDDINVQLYPAIAGLDKRMRPSEMDALWLGAPTDDTVVQVGQARAGTLLPAHFAAFAEHRRALLLGLKGRLPKPLPPERAVVINAFGRLPWRHVRTVHDLIAEIDGGTGREICLAPARIRNYHTWALGNCIWELLHLR